MRVQTDSSPGFSTCGEYCLRDCLPARVGLVGRQRRQFHRGDCGMCLLMAKDFPRIQQSHGLERIRKLVSTIEAYLVGTRLHRERARQMRVTATKKQINKKIQDHSYPPHNGVPPQHSRAAHLPWNAHCAHRRKQPMQGIASSSNLLSLDAKNGEKSQLCPRIPAIAPF